MYAMLGVGLLAATALLFAWSYGQFLRPRPKAWTRSDFAAVSVTLTTVCLLTFALAFLLGFFLNLDAETRWLEIAGMTGGAVLVCWFLLPRLMAPALVAADPHSTLDSPSADTSPQPANDPQPTPTSPAQPGRSTRKRDRRRAA